MTRLLLLVSLWLGGVVVSVAQERFSQRLTSAERQAAGLDTLTPAQLAALDTLVQRDRESGPTPPPAKTEPSAEARVARFALPEKDEPTAVQSRLAGEYRGWDGRTFFQLENGQLWVQTDSTDTHSTSPRSNPAVKVEKSMFGGYKLTVEGERLWVRVKRVK